MAQCHLPVRCGQEMRVRVVLQFRRMLHGTVPFVWSVKALVLRGQAMRQVVREQQGQWSRNNGLHVSCHATSTPEFKQFPTEVYLFWDFFFRGGGFFFGLGVCAFFRLSVPWLFGQILASCFPWLLGFSVSVILGHSTSYSFVVLYGLFACWFAWLLGFSASRLVGLDFL